MSGPRGGTISPDKSQRILQKKVNVSNNKINHGNNGGVFLNNAHSQAVNSHLNYQKHQI
jgi:hypothetical protein